MNKLIALAALGLCFSSVYAKGPKKDKNDEGFVFTTVKENPITSIKNQNRSSTCWSFSSLGYLESELLRLGKGEFDLSEMFVVHKTMEDRATNYVRYHGDASFSPGGSFEDIVFCYKNYGMVPQDVMPGIEYGDSLPNHNELDAVAGAYVQAIGKGNQSKLSPVWKKGVTAIYDTYLGECPKEFTYKGKTYTPRTFADEVLGLNMNDYVSLTSYTHHPFYQTFSIEVQDNWRWGMSYNVPVEDINRIIDNAINNGYSVMWGGDVSEQGFTRQGLAVAIDTKAVQSLAGSDAAKWLKLTQSQKTNLLDSLGVNTPEVKLTQEMRQEAFDNWETTDDHGMHLFGLAKDQNGKEYYMIKNSWGEHGDYKGIWYMTKTFSAYKVMDFMVNKNAIPKDIRKKLGI